MFSVPLKKCRTTKIKDVATRVSGPFEYSKKRKFWGDSCTCTSPVRRRKRHPFNSLLLFLLVSSFAATGTSTICRLNKDNVNRHIGQLYRHNDKTPAYLCKGSGTPVDPSPPHTHADFRWASRRAERNLQFAADDQDIPRDPGQVVCIISTSSLVCFLPNFFSRRLLFMATCNDYSPSVRRGYERDKFFCVFTCADVCPVNLAIWKMFRLLHFRWIARSAAWSCAKHVE